MLDTTLGNDDAEENNTGKKPSPERAGIVAREAATKTRIRKRGVMSDV